MDTAEPTPPPRAVIASGAGRYADPWHPFPHTSARIAEILAEDGWDVLVIDDPDRALWSLDDASLLVVNAGDPWRGGDGEPHADHAAARGLDAAIDRGIGLIAVHTGLASLRDYPRWREAIGGEWEVDRSWHPPISRVVIPVTGGAHPVTAGIPEISVFDELYTDLAVDERVHVLAAHERDAASHPLVWVCEQPTRAVATALGHDERSYESASHRALMRGAARWAGRWAGTGGE
jgi:type 1 glutamine amidotransferase